MALKEGEVFAGRFRVITPIGRGGNGEVYEVEDGHMGVRRALKVLVAHRQGDAQSRERFVRESKLAASIESDYVVRIYDHGVADDGTPWLLMERLHGQNLEEHVAQRGPLSVDDARRLAVELGHALTAAHAQGVLHLDLKPANLFLAKARRASASLELKVLDFGLARAIQVGSTHVQMTTTAFTIAWAPPEQINQRPDLRKTADVWPLGLIAFFMLTGRLYWRKVAGPEETGGIMDLVLEIAQGAVVSASDRARELGCEGRLPEGFDAWFARCLEAEPSRRWPDGGEATRALEKLLERASSVPPTSVPPPMVRVQETQVGEPVGPPAGFTMPVKELPVAPPVVEERPEKAVVEGVPWAQIGAVGGGVLAVVAGLAWWMSKPPEARPTSARDAPVVVTPVDAPAVAAAVALPLPPPLPPPRVTEEPRPSMARVASNAGGERAAAPRAVARELDLRGTANLGSGDLIGGEGNIDASRVASIIRGQLGGIRSCYERALRNNPTLSGRLEVRFTVAPTGRVSSASSAGLAAAPEVGTCVAQRIRGLVFPAPTGGSVDFSFPFTFTPAA